MSRHHAGSDAPGAHGRIWIPPVTLTDMREDAMHVLLWQVRGAMDVTIAGHSRRVDAGHGLWIPAGIPHDIVVHADSVMTPLFWGLIRTPPDSARAISFWVVGGQVALGSTS